MELNALTPTLKKSLTLPWQEVLVMPIGDIQYRGRDDDGSYRGVDIDRLERHIQWGLAQGAYFIGMGDYIDTMSPSNRKKMASIRSDLYDSAREVIDDALAQRVVEIARILRPTKGRWLGMVTGHHLWDFEDGTNSDVRLAQVLDAPYMGDGAALTILKLRYETGEGETKRAKYVTARVWYHHGGGMGTTPGAILNKLVRFAGTFAANAYILGHVPVKVSTKLPYIDYDVTSGGHIHDRSYNKVLTSSGGFAKGYELGTTDPLGTPKAGYGEKGLYPPTALGGTIISLRPKWVNRGAYKTAVIDVDYSG